MESVENRDNVGRRASAADLHTDHVQRDPEVRCNEDRNTVEYGSLPHSGHCLQRDLLVVEQDCRDSDHSSNSLAAGAVEVVVASWPAVVPKDHTIWDDSHWLRLLDHRRQDLDASFSLRIIVFIWLLDCAEEQKEKDERKKKRSPRCLLTSLESVEQQL